MGLLLTSVIVLFLGIIILMFNYPRDDHALLEVSSVSEWKTVGKTIIPSIPKVPESSRRTILLPVAFNDFDPTEVAIPWYVLTSAGHSVVFASPLGSDQGRPSADQLVLDGYLLGILRAKPVARGIYELMQQDPSFNNPIKYDEIVASEYDGLILPGGHGPDSKIYLESELSSIKFTNSGI
mmetsp:Transcript_53665/g.68921  ORF Transcript_53665/g.68921 Transcript_53665/m.68921 type:complete len:181 (+) Transcript_53665:31-573(+)